MSAVLGNIQGGEVKPDEPKTEKTEKEKMYRIKTLHITGATVTFASFLTAKAPLKVPLPDIHMQDISNADGTGIALAQVIRTVLVKILQVALTEGKGTIPTEIASAVRGDVGQLVPELRASVLEKGRGIMEKASGAVRGLFNR